jgi:hypothetical protein
MKLTHEFNINEVLYFTLEATIENSEVSQPKLLNQDNYSRIELFEIAKFMAFYPTVIKNKFLEIYRQN